MFQLGFCGPFPKAASCRNKVPYAPGLAMGFPCCEPRGRGCKIAAEGQGLQPACSVMGPAWLGHAEYHCGEHAAKMIASARSSGISGSCFCRLDQEATSRGGGGGGDWGSAFPHSWPGRCALLHLLAGWCPFIQHCRLLMVLALLKASPCPSLPNPIALHPLPQIQSLCRATGTS